MASFIMKKNYVCTRELNKYIASVVHNHRIGF
jgi:hypothetical protein